MAVLKYVIGLDILYCRYYLLTNKNESSDIFLGLKGPFKDKKLIMPFPLEMKGRIFILCNKFCVKREGQSNNFEMKVKSWDIQKFFYRGTVKKFAPIYI